jgi:outer membrane protein
MQFLTKMFGKILTATLSSVLLLSIVCNNYGQTVIAKLNEPYRTSAVDTARPLTLAEAVDLALQQASNYQQSKVNEQIIAEDIVQARANLYPKITAQPNVILNTPALNNRRLPAFLGANGLGEFQGIVNASGEYDYSGRLKATVKRNRALLESAKAGSEIAKRDLTQAVTDAYFNLAFATVLRRGAEANLQSAIDFENYIKLQLDAGEVAPVDLTRSRLQSSARRDELEISKANESILADSLRVLIGYDFTSTLATEDLLTQLPNDGEIETYVQTAIESRPEFAQFEADKLAAETDVEIAKAERKPQITYSVSAGFISDSLLPKGIINSTGIQANVGVTIPLFDRGGSKSREAQAKLKLQQTENAKIIAERQFLQAFFSARTQGLSALTRFKSFAVSIKDAESNIAASTARYQAGEAIINEVFDAQNLLISQKQAFYQAIFDYQTARSKLLRAIGK